MSSLNDGEKKRVLFIGPVDRYFPFQSIKAEEDSVFKAFRHSDFYKCDITRILNYNDYLFIRHKEFDLVVAEMFMHYRGQQNDWEKIKKNGEKSLEIKVARTILNYFGIKISEKELLKIADEFYNFTEKVSGYQKYKRREYYYNSPYYRGIKNFEKKYYDGTSRCAKGRYIIDVIEKIVIDGFVPMGWMVAQIAQQETNVIVVNERDHRDGAIRLIGESQKYRKLILSGEVWNSVRHKEDKETKDDYFKRLAENEIGMVSFDGKGSFIGMTRRSIENWDFVHWLWVNEYL